MMGQAVKAMGGQAFIQPGLRVRAWAQRKDDKPHALFQKVNRVGPRWYEATAIVPQKKPRSTHYKS